MVLATGQAVREKRCSSQALTLRGPQKGWSLRTATTRAWISAVVA